jgi:butyrate kinase
MRDGLILAINPGSTATKVGLFDAAGAEVAVHELIHDEDELGRFRSRPILDQLPLRAAAVSAWLDAQDVGADALASIAARGGLLPPLASGTYEVDATMVELLARHPRGEHASNLGAFIGAKLGCAAGVPVYVVDPVSVDEWPDHVRLSGHPLLDRECLSHALNAKAVARRHAASEGRPYEEMQLVIAHLGSGVSVSSHAGGRMIDVTNSREEGAFSTERAGGVPAMKLVDLCFSGTYTRAEIEELLFRRGGLLAYLGTTDLREALARARSGEALAARVIEAMVHQITREIAAAAAPLRGAVDAILLTGGMSRSHDLAAMVTGRVSWIAPVRAYPGEDELLALAEGALRVLRGAERARRITA